MLLAIETSCDETAVALFSTQNSLTANLPTSDELIADLIYSQVKTHQPYGGVVPEIAAREHVKRLPLLIDELLAKSGSSLRDISAVAVTSGPGLKGCLIVGLSWAKGFALAKGVPLIPINHIEGHVMSAEFALGHEYQYPTLAMVVSGGHTELVLIKGFRDYQIIARTRDDAAGEAFDKTATLLGLGYPGGPALSKKASQGDNSTFNFAISAKNDPSLFSFSGLKTAALRAINSEKIHGELNDQTICNLAASIERGIVENLLDKTLIACKTHQPKMVVIVGGVAANKTLRETASIKLEPLGIPLFAPPFSLCTDNAVMIGYTALRIIGSNPEKFKNWGPDKSASLLGPDAPANIGATPRFPIEQIATQ